MVFTQRAFIGPLTDRIWSYHWPLICGFCDISYLKDAMKFMSPSGVITCASSGRPSTASGLLWGLLTFFTKCLLKGECWVFVTLGPRPSHVKYYGITVVNWHYINKSWLTCRFVTFNVMLPEWWRDYIQQLSQTDRTCFQSHSTPIISITSSSGPCLLLI